MRAALVGGAALAVLKLIAGTGVEVPSWASLIVGLLGGGGAIRYYFARAEKRLTEANERLVEQSREKIRRETEETQDRIAGNLRLRLLELEDRLDAAERDRDAARIALAEAKTEIAKGATERAEMQARLTTYTHAIEMAHDEIATVNSELADLRGQLDTEDRRRSTRSRSKPSPDES